jgi:hypothetical protein
VFYFCVRVQNGVKMAKKRLSTKSMKLLFVVPELKVEVPGKDRMSCKTKIIRHFEEPNTCT